MSAKRFALLWLWKMDFGFTVLMGFVAQTNNSPSFPYPRGAYATVGAIIVLGLPSAVKRLSKPTRTCTSTT